MRPSTAGALVESSKKSQSCTPMIHHVSAARLATLLSGPDTWLRLVLGPPGEWQGLHGSSHQQQGSRGGHAEPVGSFTRRRSGLQRPAVRSAPAAEFQQLQKVFRLS